jgi:hypothetical protein
MTVAALRAFDSGWGWETDRYVEAHWDEYVDAARAGTVRAASVTPLAIRLWMTQGLLRMSPGCGKGGVGGASKDSPVVSLSRLRPRAAVWLSWRPPGVNASSVVVVCCLRCEHQGVWSQNDLDAAVR